MPETKWHLRWAVAIITKHVRESHPEQRTASIRHRRRHERARQPPAQLPTTVERGTEPGATRHPAQPQDRRGVARPAALGADTALCTDPSGGRKPINARCETVWDLPPFRDAYRSRRCIGRWTASSSGGRSRGRRRSGRTRSPWGTAARSASRASGRTGRSPPRGEWIRTFAIITTDANGLVADIHDRMPMILAPTRATS
jgi:putative SOS response-associated peptidase YedK